MSLTQAVKKEAHRLGFSLAGVTTSEPPPHWSAFENWLSLGRHASMDYLTDPRRADPHLVLPECQSILVLAVRYTNPGISLQNNGPVTVGRIAAYAWGSDYHLVLTQRLDKLVSFIETQVGMPVRYRGYTDTGPLLERDLAQRAGLGWIGKNTCLIVPQAGSYFLLAEVLLGIELEPDEPFTADRCGKCNRCVSACPTGCILPERILDATRCISYLTIENKQEIPSDLRSQVGNRIFGCDICQQVCPWNRFSNALHQLPEGDPGFDPAFSARPGMLNPDLSAELTLSPQEFSQKFRENPVLRSKRRGYLRNVAVALGNSGDPAVLPVLERAVHANEPLIGEHAAWAVEQIKNISR